MNPHLHRITQLGKVFFALFILLAVIQSCKKGDNAKTLTIFQIQPY